MLTLLLFKARQFLLQILEFFLLFNIHQFVKYLFTLQIMFNQSGNFLIDLDLGCTKKVNILSKCQVCFLKPYL